MPSTGTVHEDAAGRKVVDVEASTDLHEAKRAARRVEKSAHRLVQDLAILTELLPSLGIKVTIEKKSHSSGYDPEKGTDQT